VYKASRNIDELTITVGKTYNHKIIEVEIRVLQGVSKRALQL
jgi:hypothetical protein